MNTKDEIVDTGKFAAELKALAQTVLEEKAKTKPPTKTQIVASDEVWYAVKDMQEKHGMTLADIAAVFNAKGGIWAKQNAASMGSLIKGAAELRGEETDGKKGRKSKASPKRSSSASSEASPKASSNPRSEPRSNPTSASGERGAAPAASAGGASQPEAVDARSTGTTGPGAAPAAGSTIKKKPSAFEREA